MSENDTEKAGSLKIMEKTHKLENKGGPFIDFIGNVYYLPGYIE